MSSLYAQAYYPPRIQVALHGHVHNFQAINFASGQPAAIVSGNAGDNLDVALPDPFPAATQPAPGATIDRITHHSSDAVAFYNTRSTQPQKWYRGDAFDDIPAATRHNVNVNSIPLNRRRGAAPAMTDAEIDDMVTFLRTLTDAPFVAAMP